MSPPAPSQGRRQNALSPTGVTLGPSVAADGVEFTFESRNADRLVLQLYAESPTMPTAEVPLDASHRVRDEWRVFVPGIGPGQRYAVRAEGPFCPEEGLRFDGRVPLVDPAARAVTWVEGQPLSVVADERFDWQGIAPPRVPMGETVIYELHVRGFTRHPSSGVSRPGTFLGLCEKIPYLKSLGVTTVELLPVAEWNPSDIARRHPRTGRRLRNYWGYSPIAFFAPAERFATAPGRQVEEFKILVRELHRAGLEVVLDVVFNHTGEGEESRPTMSLRGLDNAAYYHLAEGLSRYRDYTGCGNSLNCASPQARRLILEALRYWTAHMHVDGFRFDLASVLQRDEHGTLHTRAPLIAEIQNDPVLRGVKLIAEPWDAAGAYQVGAFPPGWLEWNGRYRDDVRRFWLKKGPSGDLVTRFAGNSDLYAARGRGPLASVNFVTCHDGFTLRDLVSYDRKHNEDNGESNRDGSNHEGSWNHGVEGDASDPRVEPARLRTARGMLATLLLSQGVPMLLAGDERWRTQQGNNNAFCQDNEISWVDWTEPEDEAAGLLPLVRELLALRRSHPALRRPRFFAGRDHDNDGHADVRWMGTDGAVPKWSETRAVGCVISGAGAETHADEDREDLLVLINGGDATAVFELPKAPQGGAWRRAVDTARALPAYPGATIAPVGASYGLQGRSVACFVATPVD